MQLLLLPTLLLATGLAAAHSSCPTITSHSVCSTCPVNACLQLSTITNPCDCPTAVPTTTISHPCSEKCFPQECAGTSYSIVTETCGPGGGCPTLTQMVRAPDCTPPPPPGADVCVELACLEVKPVTWPCSCVGKPVPTFTFTGPCTCRDGCEVSETVAYLPCPTKPPGGGPGCPA